MLDRIDIDVSLTQYQLVEVTGIDIVKPQILQKEKLFLSLDVLSLR